MKAFRGWWWRALGPGDVVVSKFLPPRVALVTSQAPRHVPDGNCLRVLGLEPADALWLVALLAHPSFAKLVAQRGAGRTLPRIGARELAELPVPPTPPGLGPLAEAWTDAADQHLALHRGLMELRAEVQSIADDAAPPPPDPRHPSWVRAWEMPDTWAPDQAALLAYQRRLGRSGWVPLEPFLAPEPARLRARIPPARVLRLGHASGDLGYRLPELEPVRPPWFRLYADPMRPAEVLLSTLGSAPKVVVNLPTADSTVWLSDQWARLDGGSTPGALALLLGVSQVAWQLERAATGAVRQFIGRVELAKIRIPSLSRGEARALHDRLVSLLERRTRVDQQLGGLRAELAGLVDAAMRGAA